MKKKETQSKQIIKNISSTLTLLGEDITRDGLKGTPIRYAKAMKFLTSGSHLKIDEIVGEALFLEENSGMVVIRDIEFFSLCEHHLLPFFGKAHVAYLPNKKIIGLSKIPRIINAFARRFQVQERLTSQIANELMRILNAEGVAVILEASHFCMMMRGVEKQQSNTLTHCMLGLFKTNKDKKAEFLQMIHGFRRPYF